MLRPHHPTNRPSYLHPCSADTPMLRAVWWAADAKGTDSSKSPSEYTSAAEGGSPERGAKETGKGLKVEVRSPAQPPPGFGELTQPCSELGAQRCWGLPAKPGQPRCCLRTPHTGLDPSVTTNTSSHRRTKGHSVGDITCPGHTTTTPSAQLLRPPQPGCVQS